jgi:outer membrane protein assembly factor BamD (BamD/ComL family)
VDALRELASLYLTKASDAQQRAQNAQIRAAYLAPGASIAGAVQLGSAQLDTDPISTAVSSGISQEYSAALTEAQGANAKAVDMYRRITQAMPNDPSVQLELAQAAVDAQDFATAISAYEAFLKLAPDDPTAVEVRRILRQLRAQPGATG